MIFERIKSEGIAHNSYLISSGSQAAVIDPRRDCQIYVDLAQQIRDKAAKHLCERLVHEELRHKLRLETFYDDLFYEED